ncbi:hypothetical protein [Actinokineospora pegani]|uniref:hypothetical protein n=1 Tax=Actinokineospora pegani TaxID=2654637 RepID=UPI0012E9CD50|nr:hypothetical protein [Actinokineospora pegani]
MTARYRGLGFDPVPGDPDAAGTAAAGFGTAADALTQVDPAVRRAREAAAGWSGPAAERFGTALDRVPADAEARADRLRAAAEVLSAWAGRVADHRRRADDLDARAAALRRGLAAAEDDVHSARNALDLASTPTAATAAGMEHAAAESALAGLEDELARVIAAARDLEREHTAAATAAADELDALRDVVAVERPAPERAIASAVDAVSGVTATMARLLSRGGGGERVPGAAAAFAGALVPAQTSRETIVVLEDPRR